MGLLLGGEENVYDPYNDNYWQLPVETGKKVFNVTARGAAQAVKDWSNPPVKATLVGDPAFDPVSGRYMYGDKGKGLLHAFPDDAEFTWVFVFATLAACNSDTTKPVLAVSNDGLGASDGSSIAVASPGAIALSGRRFALDNSSQSAVGATLTGIDFTVPKWLSFRMGVAKVCVWNQTDQPNAPSVVGNGYAAPANRPVRVPAGRPWRTQSSYGITGYTDGIGMYYLEQYWNRYLTDAELQAERAALTPYLLGECGITAI